MSAPRPHIVNLAELPGRLRERAGTTIVLEPPRHRRRGRRAERGAHGGCAPPGATVHHPVDARAAELHASSAVETDDPAEAYASAGWARDDTLTGPAWPPAP